MQNWHHIHHSSRCVVAIYYTAVGLEKMGQRTENRQTDRQTTEKLIKEATLIVDGLSGFGVFKDRDQTLPVGGFVQN